MTTGHLDIETRSTVDLKSAGLFRYFESADTEVLVVRWRIGDGPVGSFSDIEPFLSHLREGGLVTGHNIAFDRNGWNAKIAPLYGWPSIPIEQTDCTMARCAAIAAPQDLDGAGKAIGAKITKDTEGHRLMLKMCKPKSRDPLTWHEEPEQIGRLSGYCANDVLSECAIDDAVPKLSASERKVWLLDQHINARGVKIDTLAVEKALGVAEIATQAAHERMEALTGGEVAKCTQTARIVSWLNSRGIPAASVAKGEIEDILVCADLFSDPLAREVVELRRASAKSSVAKYKAMLKSVCADDRVRGTLAYHGASTGRWAGRLIQPQNFPRILDYSDDVTMLHSVLNSAGAEAAYQGCKLLWDNPLEILSRALRSMIVAEKGHRLVGGDYSNIEGRVNAWLAGEDWKVEAFAAFDQGEGHDLYNLAYAKAFNLPVEAVTKDLRQIGKVMELSMGYQGGRRAFQKMGANYGISVPDTRAEELKIAWRSAHPEIEGSWYALQDAAIQAVKYEGAKVEACSGRVCYMVKHGILWCRLPSGRALSYIAPHIERGFCPTCNGTGAEVVWDKKAMDVTVAECDDCRGEGIVRERVAFMGADSATKQWGKRRLYGGLQCENVVQAIARDVLVEGMFRLEEAGYPIVLTVHDEVLTECPDGFGSADELATLMSVVPEWAEGLPVAVSPWEDVRYVK